MTTPPARALVVHDDVAALHAIGRGLRAHAFAFDLTTNSTKAVGVAVRCHPDVIVLGLDDLSIISRLRRWTNTPILVLRAHVEPADTVHILDSGANDCVPQQITIDELMARIRVHIRPRPADAPTPRIVTEDFEIDLESHVATMRGEPITLTAREWALVRSLVCRPGRVVTHQQLIREVWEADESIDPHNVRVHLSSIRRKLEPDHLRPRYFVSQRGIGYVFHLAGPDAGTTPTRLRSVG